MKPYFCLWFNDSGTIEERFFDTFAEAFDEARLCDVSGHLYYWGDTLQAIESTASPSEAAAE